MPRQFSIGIDLGTTNTVLAYTLLGSENSRVEVLPLAQAVAPSQVDSFSSLPSFLYASTDQEIADRAYALPEANATRWVAGCDARSNSAVAPGRTVSSAKSWLCNPAVDRHSPILPWEADDDVERISPVDASAVFLRYVIDAWNRTFPEDSFINQKVSLTVPASFDMAARELTRQAALQAGLPNDFVLLEEPQAAVYHWIDQQGDSWRRSMTLGDTLLVCDVGGGTTDLTLLQVQEVAGELQLNRLAVGNHLLVGGDNMDLALAHFASQRFAAQGTKLNPWQSISLWHSCRTAKEILLSDSNVDRHTISVLGRGSRLIGGTVSIEITRDEVEEFLVDGFFPQCEASERPSKQPASGFLQIGLPFESDTAITRHVAAFLADQDCLGNDRSPKHLLFNGGAFKSHVLRRRLEQILATWSQDGKPPKVLGGVDDLDQAVACGAAHYGKAKDEGGLRIRGGTARSYYVGIESSGLAVPGMPRPLNALCVVPFGMEEGTETTVPGKEVGLVVGQPARFRFFASAVRQNDKPGTVVRYWDEEELKETSPLEVQLDIGDDKGETMVPVRFRSVITELGVFELWCHAIADQRSWKLEFNVRE